MMAGIRPYTELKESGVDWLGSVPSHWQIRRLKTSVEGCINGTWGEDPNGHDDLLCIRVADFDRNRSRVRLEKRTTRAIPLSERKNRMLSKGDLLLEKSGGGNLQPVGVVVLYEHEVPAVCSNFVARMPVPPESSPAYLTYLHSHLYATRLNVRSIKQTTGIQNLDSYSYLNERVAFPPLSEQDAIVRFLDHADRRIRRYIRAKEKLIALLEEQKQAIIHQAVAGQVDVKTRKPYGAYKESGHERLGKVPEHWSIVPLKRVLERIVDCEHKTAPAVTESEYSVIRTTAVRNGALDWKGTYYTDWESFCEWTRRCLPRYGDVVFTREAPAGEACLVPEGRRVCLGQRTVLLRPDSGQYNSKFLVHMIYEGPPKVRVQLISQGSTVGHFNVDDIGSIPVLLPSLDEQERIVVHLHSATSRIDEAREQLERESGLLREYHTRLIADVVTGKLDVREAATTLPDLKGEDSKEELEDGAGGRSTPKLDEAYAGLAESEA